MVKPRDFDGDRRYLSREVDLLGVGGDVMACARFDAAVRDELARVGVTSAYALKRDGGVAYNTAQKVWESPHSVTHRTFMALTSNLDLDVGLIHARAQYDADKDAYRRSYELAQQQVVQLVGAFLKLDAQTQNRVRKMVEASMPRGGYGEGDDAHVMACDRLREQLLEVIALKPTGRFEVVPDFDYEPDRSDFRWTGRTWKVND